jgi:hypothetical protein
VKQSIVSHDWFFVVVLADAKAEPGEGILPTDEDNEASGQVDGYRVDGRQGFFHQDGRVGIRDHCLGSAQVCACVRACVRVCIPLGFMASLQYWSETVADRAKLVARAVMVLFRMAV